MIRLKKVLFIANTDRHIKLCHLPYMKLFQDNGYQVHVATNTLDDLPYCNKKINLKLRRNPYSFFNMLAVFRVRKLVKKEHYEIISCHTPVGGFLGRVSVIGRKKKIGTKVFYMAHGFHFFKGANFINWLLYYPLEKFLSRFSDAVITMNEEDYLIAKKKFHSDVYRIHGIGLSRERLNLHEPNLRKKLHLKNKYIVTYIAEISKRKRQFQFLERLKNHKIDRNIVFLLIGDSNIKNVDEKLKLYKNVKYLGFQENIGDYISISDLIISPSSKEGLPQNILEAKYFQKNIIGMDIRGIRDLLSDGSGILVHSLDEMIDTIQKVKHGDISTIHSDISQYYLENVMKEIVDIISNYVDDSFIV